MNLHYRRKLVERVCPGCKQPFTTRRKNKLYHNGNCRWKRWVKRHGAPVRKRPPKEIITNEVPNLPDVL